MNINRLIATLVLSTLACLNLSCIQRTEKSVTIYCATDREYAEPILKAIERQIRREQSDSVELVQVFDVEASKTLGLVTRIEQEKSQPKCDVLWNNEILHTIRLQRAGLLAPHKWPIPDSWPKSFVASDRTWIGFASRARILLVNTEKLKDREQWPQSIKELSDPKWKQRCGMANPVYGTTATHFAVLASHSQALDNVTWEDWYKSVRENAIVLAGNKQVALGVASGELDWGLTDTDDAVAEVAKGSPVAIVFPDQNKDGFGTLFIPNTVAIIKGSRNPILAAQVANNISSEKAESRLAMGNSAHFPTWPQIPDPEQLKTTGVRRASVDFELAADRWESLRDTLTLPVAKEAPDEK